MKNCGCSGVGGIPPSAIRYSAPEDGEFFITLLFFPKQISVPISKPSGIGTVDASVLSLTYDLIIHPFCVSFVKNY